MLDRLRLLTFVAPALLLLLEVVSPLRAGDIQSALGHRYDPVSDAVVSWTMRPGDSLAQSFNTGNREVRMTGFRMKILRLGKPGDLEFSLHESGRGKALETGKVPAEKTSPFFEGWEGPDFASVRRLKPGTQYELRMCLASGPASAGYEVFGTASGRIASSNFNLRFQYVAAWGDTREVSQFENPLNLDYGSRTPVYQGGTALINGSPQEQLDFAFKVLEEGVADDAGEESFAFIRDLDSPLHTILLRDRGVRPGPRELAIGSDWVILGSASEGDVIWTAVDDFSRYLSAAMGLSLKTMRSTAGQASPRRSILLGTASDLTRPLADLDRSEAFLIDSSEGERIRVYGYDEKGVMRGLQFLEDEMSFRRAPIVPVMKEVRKPRYSPRITSTPFYAKSELEMEIDPYTDNFLSRISHAGFSAIWIWGELIRVGRSDVYPELDDDVQARQSRLREVAARAARHGLDTYVYLGSQPVPAGFFEKHPGVKGTPIKAYGGDFVLCTSPEESRRFIREATADLMRAVPQIKGLVIIVGVEGFLHCHSRGKVDCPRCSKRNPEEVVAELSTAVLEGARAAANPKASVAVWPYSASNTWSRHDKLQSGLISKLPAGITWEAEVDKEGDISFGGITIPAYDYSISFVGPSERFQKQYEQAVGRGLGFWAKTEHAISLEFVQTPYIPVFFNFLERYARLRQFDSLTGVFANWQHYGFMPTIAAEVFKFGTWMPSPENEEVLRRIATREFGAQAAPEALAAWRTWSYSFREYPFSAPMALGVIQKGPAHPFFMDSSYQPHQAAGRQFKNDLSWTRPWGEELALGQLAKVEKGWAEGMAQWENVIRKSDPGLRRAAVREKGVAQAILSCLRSTINLGRFYQLRERLEESTERDQANTILGQIEQILRAELDNSREALAVIRLDSRLGYANSGKGEQIGVPRAGIYSPGSIEKKIAQVERLLNEDIPRRKAGKSR